MKFCKKLFESDTSSSLDTPYEKEHSGAFYDVYEDENGGLHMDKKDEESLKERLYFYQNYLSKEHYPIYCTSDAITDEASLNELTFSQALGLPLIAVTRIGKNGKRFFLSPGEVLNRITFEDNLRHGFGSISPYTGDSILQGDHYSVIGAMNELIANGIFLQNLERILDPMRENDLFFPVHIHAEKLPERFREEKETGAKLFMDFCPSPIRFDKKSYQRTFGRTDSMTIEEQAELAFADLEIIDDVPEKMFRLALRCYFLAIAREIVSDFYVREYHRSLIPCSVLSHDISYDHSEVDRIYVGSVFSMVAFRMYRVTETEKDAVCETVRFRYLLKKGNKKKLKRAYETVTKYFDRHPELGYLPQVFLKLMGLPYPAYQAAKYFDFSRGTFDNLLEVIGVIDYSSLKCGNLEPYVTADGVLKDPSDKEDVFGNSVFYHNHSVSSFFVNDPSVLSGEGDVCFLLSCGKQDRTMYQCFLGKEDYVNQLFIPDSWLYETPIEDGCYTVIRDFFRYLNEGYTSLEAYYFVQNQANVSQGLFFYVIFSILNSLLYEPARKFWNTKVGEAECAPNSGFVIHIIHPDKTEDALLVDRNFAIILPPDSKAPYALPEYDYELYEKMYHNFSKFYDELYTNESYRIIYYRLSILDKLKIIQYPIVCSDKKSIFQDARWTKIIDDIPELTRIRAFQTALKNDILIPGTIDDYHPFIRKDVHFKENRFAALVDYNLIDMITTHDLLRKTNGHYPNEGDTFRPYVDDYFRHGGMKDAYYAMKRNQGVQAAFDYCERVEKWYLDDLMGGTMLSPIHPIETIYQGKKRYQMVGHFFDAYSDSKDFGSFYLLKKDEPLLISLISTFMKKKFEIRAKTEFFPFFTGLPMIFLLKLKKLYEKEYHVSEAVLNRYFTFRDEESNVTDVFVNEDYQWEKEKVTNFYRSGRLRRKLLEEGFVLYPDSDFFDFNLFSQSRDENGYWKYPFYKLTCCVMEHPSSTVKTYLQPNDLLMTEIVDEFKSMARSNRDIDCDILNDVCVFVLKGYHEDPNFLIHLINNLQDRTNSLESYAYYIVKKPEWNENTRLEDREYLEHIYLMSFLLYLERNIIFTVGKKMIVE